MKFGLSGNKEGLDNSPNAWEGFSTLLEDLGNFKGSRFLILAFH